MSAVEVQRGANCCGLVADSATKSHQFEPLGDPAARTRPAARRAARAPGPQPPYTSSCIATSMYAIPVVIEAIDRRRSR
ncbi:MAG: hypothetical protein QOJ25_3384 [Solirubrobacteraceae bacterium]|jgi:hypothetical protein|nr:hypothetical protein [Solirubrobacteraceae bacterium]